MGRVMSLIGFGAMALIPISQLVAGMLIQVSLDGVLIGAGLAMAFATLLCATTRPVRRIGLEPVSDRDMGLTALP